MATLLQTTTTTILFLLATAVSLPLCDAFSPSLFNPQAVVVPTRTSSQLAVANDWFSSIPQEVYQPPEEPDSGIRKEMDPDGTEDEVLAKLNLLEEDVTKGKRKVRASVRETGYDSMRNYIKTMCNHELLNKNEEVVLAREIQLLMRWEETREELEAQLLR
jgi:Sigma-70 factor, region 1.2